MSVSFDPVLLQESIARSFGAHPVVMPVIDDLLRDIATLGMPVDAVIGVVRALKLRGVHRVLDIGCGKGMTAVALAGDLELDVTGIDAHAPFIEEAERRAAIMGLADRCRFVHGDARRLNAALPDYDAVMLLACPNLFETLADAVAALRRRVHPGGFLILDHAYAVDPADGTEALGHEATAAALTRHGDRIVMAKHGRTREAMELAEQSRRALERRARELLRTYPGIAGTVWEWVERWRREVALHATGGPLMPSIWVVQKAAP